MIPRALLKPRPVVSFKQLCVLAHYACDRLGSQASAAELIDELKWDCARARLDHQHTGRLSAAVNAVVAARLKGYRTPLSRRASR